MKLSEKPICSTYGIFINIGPQNHPNVVKYTIHGAYGYFSGLQLLFWNISLTWALNNKHTD